MGFISRHISKPIVSWLNREKPARQVPLSDFERIRYEIKPCDVILVEGRTRISEVIRVITQSSWTHAALYIGRLHDIEDPKFRAKVADHFDGDPDVQLVVESLLGFGTVVNPLTNYEGDHLRICRPKGLAYRDSQQAINFAVSRLGLEYDFRQILDLARFLFPWALWPRRWRSSLFEHHAGRPTKTVCSTMIAEAFHYIQFPILPLVRQNRENEIRLFRRNPKMCVPRDFDYSPYFEIIKYPFIDCCDYGTYRLLPWHGSGAFVGDDSSLFTGGETAAGTTASEAVTEIPDDEELIEHIEAQAQREKDPLIEEIANGNTKLAEPAKEDIPIEDMALQTEDEKRETGNEK